MCPTALREITEAQTWRKVKDQAWIFPRCLPLSVSLSVLFLPLSTLLSASLSLSLSFFLCLFPSLGVLQAVDHINSTVAPALVGSVRISLCSPLSNAYSGPSLSPDLCLCLSSSHWVNRLSNSLCEPGYSPPTLHVCVCPQQPFLWEERI